MEPILRGLSAIGYGINDYINMFALSALELDMNIVNCYAGASAFAVDMLKKKNRVVACDPLYQKPVTEIKALAEKAQNDLLKEVKQHPDRYGLTLTAVKQLIKERMQGVERFLQDLPQGLQQGHYTSDMLPQFHFRNEQFDLALVCHYLFTNSDQLTVDQHLLAIQELARVANEIRIFPLVTHTGEVSPYVGEVAAKLQVLGLGVEIRGVPFIFQKHDNAMMRVWNQSCTVSLHQSGEK